MIRFATIGTNFVTAWFLEAAAMCDDLSYAATYSRREEKATEFATQHNAEKIHTSLTALAEDSDIDAVYIASPTALHFAQAALMLSHGKHVLCEKPVASNCREFERLLEIAAEHGTVILEAMRSAYDPGFAAVAEVLPRIGTVRRATFQFCQYSSRYDKFKAGIVENAFNPVLSNGALMDIGVYCVHPLVRLFGRPDRISADAVKLANGLDGAGTILAGYDSGMQAELLYSKISDSRIPSQIQGEAGSLTIGEIANPRDLVFYPRKGEAERIAVESPAGSTNMGYEIREWVRLIQAGGAEENPHSRFSLLELEVMDEARRLTGIRFPADSVKS